VLLGLNVPSASAAQSDVEYKVKAAFLLNFAHFVTWPAQSSSSESFPLCVVGEDPFGEALTGIETKKVDGKHVSLHYLKSSSSKLGQCRMVFISRSEKNNLSRILGRIAGKPVVSVSDIDGFSVAGGLFEFKDQRGRLSFIINHTQAKSMGLSISSSLLNLAVDVL
jgi:hypothetical protein